MMDPRKVNDGRQRVLQIAALALVWGIAVVALVAERIGTKPRAAAPAKARAPAAPAVGLSVDVGRVQLRACRIEAVSFRSADEGWVTDACGHAYHTADGGAMFAEIEPGAGQLAQAKISDDASVISREITRIEWLSDLRALAFVYAAADDPQHVLVTSDGGARWRRRPLGGAGGEMIYASAHAGRTVWACGSSGAIFRSRDGGDSFARTRRTPFDGDDRCMALSFVDERRGWAGGMDGTLFETDDGGDGWTALRVPVQPRATGATTLSDRPVFDLRVTGVARLSAREGWIAMQREDSDDGGRTFVTGDGGQTWIEAKAPAAIAARLAGGTVHGDRAIFARRGRLVVYAGAELVRDTPLAGGAAHPTVPEIARGREPLERAHTAAWTDHAIIESFDDGRSWSTVARVGDDEAIRRVVHPKSEGGLGGGALVELADGRIVKGRDELLPSAQPEFDRFVMAFVEARRRGAPPPPGPLDCLAAAGSGRVEVRGGVHGCEFSHAERVSLGWDPSGATLSLPDRQAKLAVAAPARRDFLASLAAAVERPDDGDHGCTTEMFIDLTWQCGPAAPLRASFRESHCADRGGAPAAGPAHRVEAELMRLALRSAVAPRP